MLVCPPPGIVILKSPRTHQCYSHQSHSSGGAYSRLSGLASQVNRITAGRDNGRTGRMGGGCECGAEVRGRAKEKRVWSAGTQGSGCQQEQRDTTGIVKANGVSF